MNKNLLESEKYRYVSHAQNICYAVQWTGANKEEIDELFGERVRITTLGQAIISNSATEIVRLDAKLGESDLFYDIERGNWLVWQEDELWNFYPDAFKVKFIKYPQEKDNIKNKIEKNMNDEVKKIDLISAVAQEIINFERPEGDEIPELLKKYKPNELTIYLSGPISSIPYRTACRIFGEAHKSLRTETEFEIVNPFSSCSPSTWYKCMSECFELMENCDAIVMLDGWEKSKGANIELMMMLLHDKPVVTIDDLLKASLYHAIDKELDENQDNQA